MRTEQLLLSELGDLASCFAICFRVDLYLGAFVLPFACQLGYELSGFP